MRNLDEKKRRAKLEIYKEQNDIVTLAQSYKFEALNAATANATRK